MLIASRKSLHPNMVAFKGKLEIQNDNIIVLSQTSSHVPCHLFSTGCHRTATMFCQAKVWFDEDTMLEWVKCILAPYVLTALPDMVPILLLDSFSVHMKVSITTVIQNLGVEVFFIPPGCTGLVQPMDVEINSPSSQRCTRSTKNGCLPKSQMAKCNEVVA